MYKKTFAKFNNYIVQYDDEKISKKMNENIEKRRALRQREKVSTSCANIYAYQI